MNCVRHSDDEVVIAAKRIIRAFKVLAVICSMFLSHCHATAIARDASAARELLQQHGIEASARSLHEFFASMNPQGDVIAATKRLIQQLDDNDFGIREQATKELLRTPQLPLDLLTESTERGSPELRWRAKLVLAQATNKGSRLLNAALRVVESENLPGFCTDIIDCAEHYRDSPSLERLARRAFLASVSKQDQELLRRIASHANPAVRICAVRALVKVLGPDGAEELRVFLRDDSDEARMEATGWLANQGDRQAIRSLPRLLDSDELTVRSQAAQLLRGLTDQNFRFVAYAPSAERKKAISAWENWLDNNLDDAVLKPNVSFHPERLGRILVCYYNTNRVVEYDESRSVVWELSINQPWGCQGLPNGHRLITSYKDKLVTEYDADGVEVWRATVPGQPASVKRLERGNTLIPLYSKNRVVELSPKGKVVSEFRTEQMAAYVDRTVYGRTLVALNTAGVLELDDKGKQLGRLPSHRAFSVRQLGNGHLLIADPTGEVKELRVTRDKKNPKTMIATPVWSFALASPYDALRLDSGNTLIAHQGGLVEVNTDGEIVWNETGKGTGIRVCYY